MYKKILITGNAGSGKTTLSRKLAKFLNRQDIYNLDRIVWRTGWRSVSEDEKHKQIIDIASRQTWIADGVSKSLLEAADTIIFLDYPRHICYRRCFKRNIRYLFKSRPELPDKCPEILIIPKLTKIIWNFPILVRPIIINHMHDNEYGKMVFHIKSNYELCMAISKIKDFHNLTNVEQLESGRL